MLIYAFMIFFEKPFHCYARTTFNFYQPTAKASNDCDANLEMMDIYIIDNMLYYRIIELFLLFCFALIQIVFWAERKALGNYTIQYKILQTSLMIIIFICVCDILLGLIFDFFPLVNFFLRAIVIILLVKNLRTVWVNIIYLLYDTKNIFFLLFAVLFWFGLLGSAIFKFSEDFKSLLTSMYSLFILLATCNFPDVMLGTFNMDDKSSMLFFIVYLILNFFIVLSLLKSLYYSSYFEVYKARARKMVKVLVEENSKNKKIFESDSFQKLLIRISENYSFSKEEYMSLVSLVDTKDVELFTEEFFSIWKTDAKIQFNFFVGFLRKRKIELALTIFDVLFNILILAINTNNSVIGVVLQLIWYSVFVYEMGCYVYYEGLTHFVKTDLIRFMYLLINLLNFIGMLIVLVFIAVGKETENLTHIIFPLVFLRSIRFMILLNIFPEFRIIFTTLHNMKIIFYGLFASLFSFFLLFSSLSMYFTGGHITKNAFDEMRDIPANYKYLNFNDFPSSFITCFALMMINNLNILARSLSFGVGQMFRAYFALFYFMATLIILNIIQTLMLEMYLTIKANKIDAESEDSNEDKKEV